MSFLEPMSNDITKVIEYLDKYNSAIEEIDLFFDLDNKKVVEISKQLPQKIALFKSYSAELKSIIELIELKRNEYTGKRWKQYNEGYSRQLASKDIQQYISGEEEFNSYSEFVLEVQLVKNKIDAYVEGLNIMHWRLSDITKLAIASLDEWEM